MCKYAIIDYYSKDDKHFFYEKCEANNKSSLVVTKMITIRSENQSVSFCGL